MTRGVPITGSGSAWYIHQGNAGDFESLWEWGGDHVVEQAIFMDRMRRGVQELWVAESQSAGLVGELHIAWASPDPDEANGKNRAYLHTFRVHPSCQRRGIGTALMHHCLDRVAERGCGEVTMEARHQFAYILTVAAQAAMRKLTEEEANMFQSMVSRGWASHVYDLFESDVMEPGN